MSAVSQERRLYPRLNFRIPMRYKRLDRDCSEPRGSLIKNISQGGAMITGYEFLPLNSKLTIEIPLLAKAKSIAGVGRIVWVKQNAFSEQYDSGVEFVNLNQGDGQQISQFILEHSAEIL
ncbi:MAG: PilZ domain-containing protein [Candidatus Omnitrophica bacterium]|nr:PilZ domain-containing protein [Candidatus Omnitrophota bacterium]